MFTKIRFLSVIIGVLFGFSVHAANLPQAADVCQFGGSPQPYTSAAVSSAKAPYMSLPTTALGKLKLLFMKIGTSTSGNFYAFYEGGTQYTVPNGKHFVVCGFWVMVGTTGSYDFQFGYATATFANDLASGTPPTGAVYYGTGTATTNHLRLNFDTTNTPHYFPMAGLSFPPLSTSNGTGAFYPWLRIAAADSLSMQLWGFEI
jgi:hypothetical protein